LLLVEEEVVTEEVDMRVELGVPADFVHPLDRYRAEDLMQRLY
jgi:hypothetical protein